MKIVVASPSFSKSLHLRNKLLNFFSDVCFNDDGLRFAGQELIDFISDADAAIVGLEKIDEEVLRKCSNLKIVSKYGVGLDNIDQIACNKYNVKIGWKAGVNKTSVAEQTIGFMLNLFHNISVTSNQIRKGLWIKNGGIQLSGHTIGLIGIGNIGKEVVRLLKPFNCKILVNDVIDQSTYYLENNLIEMSKKDLLKMSDIISIHTPLNDEMHHFINRDTLNIMKSNAFLINTARGSIIRTNDLVEAIKLKKIAGAAMDVFETEPLVDESLIELENVICTPHIAGNSKEAIIAMGESAIEQLIKIAKEQNL